VSRLAGPALLVWVAAGAAAGCGHGRLRIGAALPPQPSRAELLDRASAALTGGALAAAGDALAALADRERGRPDPELDFWSDLLAFARCEPLESVPRVAPGDPPLRDPWERLRRLVQIERVRLTRTPQRLAARPALIGGAKAARDEALRVRWPLEPERWPDETVVPVLLNRCAETAAPPPRPERASPAEVALVSSVARAFPPGHPAAPALDLEAAVLDVAHGQAPGARALLDRSPGPGAAPLAPGEQRAEVLAAALAAIGDPATPPERVLAATRAALRLDLPAGARRGLALRAADRLVVAKHADDAAAILGPPPHGDDPLGRYIAFRQAQAHARANRRAELLAEAREALGRHGRQAVDEDPALAAIMDLALRTLRASPVSPETIEVLEALGPPRERLARAEAFGTSALEGGAPASAMATFAWLYQNDPDPARQLRHLARECVAAARAGSRAEFARTFRLLAGQEKDDGGPSGRGKLIASSAADAHRDRRRASRSADWQEALLVVARDALPALVDANDQADLATLVATLKAHLDEAGRGPVDDELTTLYRAASAHLESGPRAYAETVGAERRPILLGEIQVDRSYDVRPPAIDLTPALEEAGPLVFVPVGRDPAVLRRWSDRAERPRLTLSAGGTR
jgi:hypothetical protein